MTYRNLFVKLSMIALGGLCLVPLGFARDDSADLRKFVESHEQHYYGYMQKHDTSGLVRFLTDSMTADYVAYGPDGKITDHSRQEAIDKVKQALTRLNFSDLKFHIAGIKPGPRGTVVTTAASLVSELPKAKAPDGVDHRVLTTWTKENTWVRVGGKWKCRMSKTLLQSQRQLK